MPDKLGFLMAGGGTGGHVIPALAVARELKARGHEPYFVGTQRGAESRLVPAAGFPLDFIRIGGLQGLGLTRKVTSVLQLIGTTMSQFAALGRRRPAAIFSMGGYVAGPPVLAGLLRRIPVVVMEPNAAPGLTNRWIARFVACALLNFEDTKRFFRHRRAEVTGLPVRDEFFSLEHKPRRKPFTVVITGGSQGSRTLNEAARQAWPLLRALDDDIYLIHQTGAAHYESLHGAFEASGIPGEISPFLSDMAGAYARADLIVCRAGAGAVSELAAAGKPSVLIPFPFATDDHQFHNARRFEEAGAALLITDKEWTGERMFAVVRSLSADAPRLARMGDCARSLAHPGAARRAAEILEEVAQKTPARKG